MMLEINSNSNTSLKNTMNLQVGLRNGDSSTNSKKRSLSQQMANELGNGNIDSRVLQQMQGEIFQIADDQIDVVGASINRILVIIKEYPDLKDKSLSTLQQIFEKPTTCTEVMPLLEVFVENPTLKSNAVFCSEFLMHMQTQTANNKIVVLPKDVMTKIGVVGAALSGITEPLSKLVKSKYPSMYDAINDMVTAVTDDEKLIAMQNAVKNVKELLKSENKQPTTKGSNADTVDGIAQIFGNSHTSLAEIVMLLILLVQFVSAIQKIDGLVLKSASDLANLIRDVQLFYAEFNGKYTEDPTSLLDRLKNYINGTTKELSPNDIDAIQKIVKADPVLLAQFSAYRVTLMARTPRPEDFVGKDCILDTSTKPHHTLYRLINGKIYVVPDPTPDYGMDKITTEDDFKSFLVIHGGYMNINRTFDINKLTKDNMLAWKDGGIFKEMATAPKFMDSKDATDKNQVQEVKVMDISADSVYNCMCRNQQTKDIFRKYYRLFPGINFDQYFKPNSKDQQDFNVALKNLVDGIHTQLLFLDPKRADALYSPFEMKIDPKYGKYIVVPKVNNQAGRDKFFKDSNQYWDDSAKALATFNETVKANYQAATSRTETGKNALDAYINRVIANMLQGR